MKLSTEDWKAIEEELKKIYGHVVLRVDGYKLTIAVRRVATYRYGITVYVNGYIKGEWMIQDCEERRRFYYPRKHYVYGSKAKRDKMTKGISKKLLKRMNWDIDKVGYTYSPRWPSAKLLKAHLLKNNVSIEWVNRPTEQPENSVAGAGE